MGPLEPGAKSFGHWENEKVKLLQSWAPNPVVNEFITHKMAASMMNNPCYPCIRPFTIYKANQKWVITPF